MRKIIWDDMGPDISVLNLRFLTNIRCFGTNHNSGSQVVFAVHGIYVRNLTYEFIDLRYLTRRFVGGVYVCVRTAGATILAYIIVAASSIKMLLVGAFQPAPHRPTNF